METYQKIKENLNKSNEKEKKVAETAEPSNEEDELKPLPMARSESVDVPKEEPVKDEASSSSAISLVKSFIDIIQSASADNKKTNNFKYLS